jgi:hypothetical protein
LREGLPFEDVILLDCFFLIAFFGGFACFLRRAFFARFVVAVLDFVFFFVFFLLDGMAAVYHRDSSAAATSPKSGTLAALSAGIFRHATAALAVARPAQSSMIRRKPKMNDSATAKQAMLSSVSVESMTEEGRG